MSSPHQADKSKVISLFLNGLEPTQMARQLVKDGIKINRQDMKNIVHEYVNSLPQSINDVDINNMSDEQISNLKEVINGKLEIDTKIHKYETMKGEVGKLKQTMGKLYPELVYAPELELISNSIKYALDVGVPRYLIKKRFINLNKISTNVWCTKKISGYRNLHPKLKPPGVY